MSCRLIAGLARRVAGRANRAIQEEAISTRKTLALLAVFAIHGTAYSRLGRLQGVFAGLAVGGRPRAGRASGRVARLALVYDWIGLRNSDLEVGGRTRSSAGVEVGDQHVGRLALGAVGGRARAGLAVGVAGVALVVVFEPAVCGTGIAVDISSSLVSQEVGQLAGSTMSGV